MALNLSPPAPSRLPCGFGRWAADLPDDDRAELDAALELVRAKTEVDPFVRTGHTSDWLASELADKCGVEFQPQMIRRHIAGKCGCRST